MESLDRLRAQFPPGSAEGRRIRRRGLGTASRLGRPPQGLAMAGMDEAQPTTVSAVLADHGDVDQSHLERPEAALAQVLGAEGRKERPNLGTEGAHMGKGHVGGRPDWELLSSHFI